MKAIPVNVFRNGKYDCTNGGISSRFPSLLVVCDDGWIDIDENKKPETEENSEKEKDEDGENEE